MKNRRITGFAAAVMLLCVACASFGVDLVEEKQLAENVIEKVYADGSREIVANGTVLRDDTPAPEPFAARIFPRERQQGYVLYQRGLSDHVFRHSSPQPEERIRTLATMISLGEKRHVQFAVYGLQDLGQVQVSVGSLVREDGTALPDEAVCLRPVRLGLWRNYWNPTFREVPKLIDLPGGLTEVVKGENQQYWVTVHVPETAEPGEYSAKLLIQPETGQPAELTMKVEVLPFQLVPGRWWGIYYYPAFNPNTPRDFADMKAHGVNAMLICPPGHREPVLERQGDKIVASFPLTDKAMAELKRQGFRSPIAYYPRLLSCRVLQLFDRVDGEKFKVDTYYGQTSVHYKAEDFPEDLKSVMKDLYQQMVRHAKEADWPEVLWYLVDEPSSGSVELEWAKVEYPLFTEACPDARILCTAYSEGVVEAIGVPLHVRVGDLWRIEAGAVKRAEEEGAEIWGIRWLCQYNTYGFPRHYAGFGLDKIGVQGFTEWTYYGAPRYSPYAQLLNPRGCYYAYTDEEGRLLSTITWEAAQEGIDDARYIATLRKFIQKASTSEDPAHKARIGGAQLALERVINQIPEVTGILPESKLDQMRAELAKQIGRFVRVGVTLGN